MASCKFLNWASVFKIFKNELNAASLRFLRQLRPVGFYSDLPTSPLHLCPVQSFYLSLIRLCPNYLIITTDLSEHYFSCVCHGDKHFMYIFSHVKSETVSCSVVSNSLWPHGLLPARLLWSWKSPGKNNGVGSHSLLQGIFLNQGSNPVLPYCQRILYHLSHQGSPFSQIILSV